MQTVYTIKAKNAILYPDAVSAVGQCGVALRDPQGRVFFLADATGLWTDITAVPSGRVQLLGDTALVLEAALADGDLVVRASRTVTKRAA